MTNAAPRYPAIDYLKAAAIVAVAVTHAGPNVFKPGVPLTFKISSVVTCFHVPAFLLVAGFLATRGAPTGWRDVASRLQRILVPYLVATAVALALGFWEPRSLRKVLFVLVTGAGEGTWYFIPVLASCFLLLPVLSRLPTRALVSLVVVLAVYTHASRYWPEWRLSRDLFWGVRDIFAQFHLGNFVLGIVAARVLPALTRFGRRWHQAILVICAAFVVAFTWYSVVYFLVGWRPLYRTAYMLSVAALVVRLVPDRPAPAPIRFLSDATLTIYLYHLLPFRLVGPETRALLVPFAQLVVLSGLGLAFGTAVVLTGRRLLGRHSRLLLGA